MWTPSFIDPANSATENELGAALRFYRRLAENGLGLMCCHDLEGILLWINPAAAESLGYAPEEGIGTSLENYLVPKARRMFSSYLSRIRLRGSDNGIMRLRTKGGDHRIWLYRNFLSDDAELPPHVLGHALDITEQFRAEQALKDLFERAPVAYIEVDSQYGLRRINKAARDLLGCSLQQIMTHRLSEGIGEIVELCAATSKRTRLVKFTRGDGRRLSIEIHSRLVEAADLLPAKLLCALIDVSERVQAEEEVHTLNAELEGRVVSRTAQLEDSNAELREFAYVASHDLQTPLQQVGTVLGQLERKSADPETTELLRQSQVEIRRMLMLVDGLLNYAIVSNAGASSPVREIPLAVTVEETLMSLASLIASSEAVVVYANLPHVLVDELSFVQLFQNLIGNAIKYRGSEPPRIVISAEADAGFWTISVADNGIGVDAGNSKRIFEPFRRLHGKEYSGCGIGLAICKKIVVRMGGQIWVESQPGYGSTFRFTVPR